MVVANPISAADSLGRDIQVLKTYGAAPYAAGLRKLEKQIKEKQTSVNEKIGVKVGYVSSLADVLEFLTSLQGIRHWTCASASLGCRC